MVVIFNRFSYSAYYETTVGEDVEVDSNAQVLGEDYLGKGKA